MSKIKNSREEKWKQKKIEKGKMSTAMNIILIFLSLCVISTFFIRLQHTPKKTLTVTQEKGSNFINVKLTEGFSEYTDSYVFKEDLKEISILVAYEETDSVHTESLKNLPKEIKGGILSWKFESNGQPLTGWNRRW